MPIAWLDLLRDVNPWCLRYICHWLQWKAQQDGLSTLSPTERTLYLADRFQRGMASWGFYSPIRWNGEAYIREMIAALISIEAKETAKVLLELIRLFPEGTFPADPMLPLEQ